MNRLKENINPIAFLNTITETCSGDVWFYTEAGDEINLKSEFSRYVFLTICTDPALLKTGSIRLDHPQDLEPLQPFIAI